MTFNSILFKESFAADFRAWLNLDNDKFTVNGIKEKEFSFFWDHLFARGLSLAQIDKELKVYKSILGNGPVKSWLEWLYQHLLIYLFIHSNQSVKTVSLEGSLALEKVSALLINFLQEQLGSSLHLSKEERLMLHQEFSVYYNQDKKAQYSWEKVCQVLNWGDEERERVMNLRSPKNWGKNEPIDSSKIHAMESFELCQFNAFNQIYSYINSQLEKDERKAILLTQKNAPKTLIKYFIEFVVIILAGIGLVFIVSELNKLYEDYLVSQINISTPKLEWKDDNIRLSQKIESRKFEPSKSIELASSQLENKEEFLQEVEREGVESEVILTSWEELPQDINKAQEQLSLYEEANAGFRDTLYGRRKVYRVIMKSPDPFAVKVQIKQLLQLYQVTKGDRVTPGTHVPGGLYYNLFVPRNFLKEFLAKVTDLEESQIFESRSRKPNPKGKNKVFIWIKRV